MLKQLRDKKRARRLMLAALILIIPSFVLFYGWSQITDSRRAEAQRYARFSPPGAYRLWFKNWRKWHDINYNGMVAAQGQVVDRLATMFGRQQVNQLRSQYGQDALVPPEATINQALNDYVLRDYAADQKITVSPDRIKQQIVYEMSGLRPEFWKQAVAQMGYPSEKAYYNAVGERVRMQAAEATFLDRVPVSLYEAWESYRMGEEKLALNLVSFELIEYRKQIEIAETALRDYYKDNAEDFRVDDQRRYRFAYLKKSDLESDVTVTSDAVRKWYDDHPDDYKSSLRMKVRQIVLDVDPEASAEATTRTFARAMALRRRIDAGEDFAKVAAEVKQKAPSEVWIEQSSLRDVGYAYAKAVLALEGNAIVGPVRATGQTMSGYAIAQVVERKEPGRMPFEEVAADVRRDALDEALDEALNERGKEMGEKADAYSTLEGMAKELKIADGLTTWVLVGSPFLAPELGYLQKANADFIKMLTVGESSGVLHGRNMVYIVRPVEEKPSHVPAFEEIRDEVENAYRDAKGRELIERKAREFAASVQSGDSLTSVAAKNGLKSSGTPLVLRSALADLSSMPAALKAPLADFPLDSFRAGKGDVGVSAASYGGGDPLAYVVWQVREIQTPDRETFQKDLARYAANQVFSTHRRLVNEWLWDERHEMVVETSKNWRR